MGPADSRRISRVPRYSGAGLTTGRDFAYGAFTRSGPPFQAVRLSSPGAAAPVLQPRKRLDARGLGSCAFARRYWRNHSIIFSSCGYLDVSVPRVRLPAQRRECGDRSPRVSPFGHRRITGHLPLPDDFRSLSRPSSPPRAAGIPRAPLLAFALHLSFARDDDGPVRDRRTRARLLSLRSLLFKCSLLAFPTCQ